MKATPRPQHLELDSQGQLVITWSDQHKLEYPVALLRDTCPCATCREKRKAPAESTLLPVLSAEELQPLKIAAMSPVGSYAYSIVFSDGHDSGIYTLEHLYEVGRHSA